MFSYLVAAIWFFMPAGLANATPVLASKIPGLKAWKTPLDLGLSYNGKRLLGDNKTVRGLVFGTVVAALTALLLRSAAGSIPHLHYLEESKALLSGALMGIGALLGDAVESFFKRQRGVEPGHGWFPFDQIDYIIGGLALSYWLLRPDWQLILAVLVVWFGLHLLTVFVFYHLGIRDKPI